MLAVDDDPSVRQMISDYLGDYEMRVTSLDSSHEIREVIARETIDVMILDLKRPERTECRSHACCSQSVPIMIDG